MYNENDNTDLTGTESETTENNDNSSGTYGGSFKDYTYSTYDYNSFYDENYSNSYDKANNTTDNSESQTSYNSTVDKLDDNKVSETLSDDSDSIDSFKIIDNLNSVDSFEAFDSTNVVNAFNSTSNNLNNSTNNSQQIVPPDEDATIYLDEFWKEAVNYNHSLSKIQKMKNKLKLMHIPTIIAFIIAILTIVFGYIGISTSGVASSIFHDISNGLFFLTFFVIIIVSIFFRRDYASDFRPKYLKDILNYQNIDSYLYYSGRTTFKSKVPYCLTEPASYEETKKMCTNYIIFSVLTLFVIGNIITFMRFGMSITPIFVSNIILIFPCVGLIIIFNALDPYMQLKSGYYDETVEAVCVEVESKIRRSSSVSSNSNTTTVVYRPFLYARCNNGQKYILFNDSFNNFHIPYVGEITKLKLNSHNPLKFVVIKSKLSNQKLWFGIIWLILGGLIYFSVVFNTTF